MYEKEIKCPFCDFKTSEFEFQREWTNQQLFVDEVKCPSCKGVFRIYHGKRKNGGEIAYTIPKGKSQ